MVLPYINMNLPQVYTCSPSWTLLPPPSSLLPLCTIPLGHPSAPAPSIQYHASNLDWWLISYMILYMFQCHSLPGAGVRSSAHGKGHEEGDSAHAKAGLSLRSPPGYSRASTPQTRVCLLYCCVLSPLTLRGLSPTTISLSLKRVNLQLQLISSWALLLLGVFKSKPLR